jgi:acyl-CoA synthetase (NDP forming)
VNPKGSEMLGLKMYPSVREIPGPVDLADIMVPARFVPQVLEDCLAKGVKGAQIFTSGFAETDQEEGTLLEEKLKALARNGIRIIGPNCFGVYCPEGGHTLLPGGDFPQESGPVAFITQSGGHAVEFARQARGTGIRFSKVISYGNACDVNECDLLEYMARDNKTRIITMYLEGPRREASCGWWARRREAGPHLEGRARRRRPGRLLPHRLAGRRGGDLGGRVPSDRCPARR